MLPQTFILRKRAIRVMLNLAALHGTCRKKGLIFYDNETCLEGPRFLTLRIIHLEDSMEQTIIVCEAVTDKSIAHFFAELHAYHRRDIFPAAEDAADLAYFLSEEYLSQLKALHGRKHDRLHLLFFERSGQQIGFAMPVIYETEDDKCFIMEFCVYPAFRGNGIGLACGEALLSWARRRGAGYFELNCGTVQRERFWGRLGFRRNGRDEWGETLLLRPPEENVPIAVRWFAAGADNWQLWKLENGYRAEIGEALLDEKQQARLLQAIQDGRITFFAAYRKSRMVGMCSVSRVFSTFACADNGVFEDFYVEPMFRKHSIARQLASAAQEYCKANRLASLTVTCAPCDENMYRSLGFIEKLGTTFARLS